VWDAPHQKRKKIKYYLKQVLTNAALVAIIFYTGFFSFHSWFLYLYIGVIIFTTVVQIITARNSIKKQGEKFAADEQNSLLFTEKTLEAGEHELLVKDSYTENKYQWKAFTRKHENQLYYFLFINSLQAIIIPKRCFKILEDRTRFEKLLNQHLSLDAELGYMVK
jgi:ABC-type transport system involved in cytochrome bd biosynthesis fused ATPase/permease subunit